MFVNKHFLISGVYISKIKRCYNAKPSAYHFYVKKKISVDFLHKCTFKEKCTNILNKYFTRPARMITRFPVFYCFLETWERTYSFNVWGYQSPNFWLQKRCRLNTTIHYMNTRRSKLISETVRFTVLYISMARFCIEAMVNRGGIILI